MGDTEAVRRRYYSQLSPPAVSGVRVLIDSASLLWRWQVTAGWDDAAPVPPIEPVLAGLDEDLLTRPQTPFVAMHAAFAWAAAGDPAALRTLAGYCRESTDPTTSTIVAGLCDALLATVEGRWDAAAGQLAGLLPTLVRIGGSAAQRDVVEETLLLCLLRSGRSEEASAILTERLHRRPSPLDAGRQARLARQPAIS